jgi:lipopolysaccharide export system permease protein
LEIGDLVIYQRYIISEIIKPAAAIFFVMAIIFVSYIAVSLMTEALSGALPLATVGYLLLLKTGMASEVLLPTTFYLAVIIALGRLYMDSEMTAFFACGLSITDVLKTVAILSLPASFLAGGASLYVRPECYEKIYQIMEEAQNDFDISRLIPKSFLEIQSGKMLFYAEDLQDADKVAKQVFVRTADNDKRQIIQAKQMQQIWPNKAESRILRFSNGTLFEFKITGEDAKATRFEQADYPMSAENKTQSRYRHKAASTLHLLQSSGLDDIAELQWRLSVPLSTILLAVLGVPLSRSNPRKGKYAKIGVAIVIFAAYFQLFIVARTWVEKGKVPPTIGVWWVPGLLVIFTALLLWRKEDIFYRRPR